MSYPVRQMKISLGSYNGGMVITAANMMVGRRDCTPLFDFRSFSYLGLGVRSSGEVWSVGWEVVGSRGSSGVTRVLDENLKRGKFGIRTGQYVTIVSYWYYYLLRNIYWLQVYCSLISSLGLFWFFRTEIGLKRPKFLTKKFGLRWFISLNS